MSYRSNLLSSVALALALSAVLLPAFAQNNSAPAVPALSAAEKQNAFAPASPQTEPATASPREQAAAKPPANEPVSTSALTPAPVENVPVPAPVAVAPTKPAATTAAPDVPTSISATPGTSGATPAKPAGASATASVSPAAPDARDAPAAGATPRIPPAVPEAAPPQAATPPAAPAPADAATPAPAKPAAPVQAAAADAVATALNGKLTEIASRGPYAKAVSDFYTLRGGAPLWVQNDALTPVAKGLIERMSHADEDGLDASAYRVPGLDALGKGDANAEADAEIAISLSVLSYIREASSGRVDTKEIGRDIVAAPNMPDALAALASVAIASDPVAVLDGYNPIAPQYLALKRKLAEVRAASAANAQNPPPTVPSGPTLKVGMSDTRVALLRTRLGVTADDSDSDVYDEALQNAVREFQTRQIGRAHV